MVKKSDKYFNTTNEDKEYVEKRTKKCECQEDRVLNIFILNKKPLTASQVWEMYGGIVTPLTSIRRAITRLKNANKLIKTEEKQNGMYNEPEYFYKLVEKTK